MKYGILDLYLEHDIEKVETRFWSASPGIFLDKMSGKFVSSIKYSKNENNWWPTFCALIFTEKKECHSKIIASKGICDHIRSTVFFKEERKNSYIDNSTSNEGIIFYRSGVVNLFKNDYWPNNEALLTDEKLNMNNSIRFVIYDMVHRSLGFPMKG